MADDRTSTSERVGWKLSSLAAGVVGGVVARKISNGLFDAIGGASVDAPLNPADRRVDWGDAIGWALAAGVGAGLGRLLSQRAAAAGWEAATGSAPPGIRS